MDLIGPVAEHTVVTEIVQTVAFPQTRLAAEAEVLMETAEQVAQLTCLAVMSPGTLAREVHVALLRPVLPSPVLGLQVLDLATG